jgi:hypothetical protein
MSYRPSCREMREACNGLADLRHQEVRVSTPRQTPRIAGNDFAINAFFLVDCANELKDQLIDDRKVSLLEISDDYIIHVSRPRKLFVCGHHGNRAI